MTKYQKIERYGAYWNWEVSMYKGDDLIMSGTIKEIAEARGIRKDTIRWYLYPTSHRRTDSCKDQSKVIRFVRLDGDDDGES